MKDSVLLFHYRAVYRYASPEEKRALDIVWQKAQRESLADAPLTPYDVKRRFCDRHSVTMAELRARSQTKRLTALRRALAIELRDSCSMSTTEIGRELHRTSHTVTNLLNPKSQRKAS